MSSVNKVILVGNLGDAPKISTSQNGSKMAFFSIATSEQWYDKKNDKRESRTDWHNVVVFNDTLIPVLEKYATKGTKVYVEGQLQTREYNDKKTGEVKKSTDVVLQKFKGAIQLLSTRESNEQEDDRSPWPDD